MPGFNKIEFNDTGESSSKKTSDTVSARKPASDFAKSSTSDDPMAKRRNKSTKKRNINIPKKVYIGLGIFVFLMVLIAIPTYATYQSGLKTYRQAQLIKDALKKQDIALASEEITKTQANLEETQNNFKYLAPLKYIPVLGWYVSDADHALKAADHGLDSGKIVTESLAPYADVLGLKGEGSFSGSTQDRIKTAVLSMGKITPEIDRIETSLVEMQKEIDQIKPGHYPKWIFGNRVQDQVTQVRTLTDQAATAVSDAKPLIKTLPSLLGEEEKKKYLVIFQNDKELRATGGFITAYAVFSIDQGQIQFEKSDDIYKLDDSIPNKPTAPEPILKYLAKVPTLNLRDSNLSPDFIESMGEFEKLYNKAGLKEDGLDGIIAIDTNVLVEIIKVLDDQVVVGDTTFTTEIDERCDCPQVIYALENDISRPVNYIKTDRKSIIGDLISSIMVKALTSSPKLYWGDLFQTLISQTNQKHVLFYLYDEQAQEGIESLNAAGRILPFEGDYLHINEVSFSGAKVNIFLEEEVKNEYAVDKDGTITKTVTVKWKNPYPPSDCNLERGGLCLNAEYRNWIRFYVPEGSELIDSKGSQVKMTTYEDLGKTVIDGFATVRPQGVAELTVTYKLPFKLEKGSPLPVLIQKQPGATDNEYEMIVDGKTVDIINLIADTETEVKF